MTTRIAVVGASGRVGRALCAHLADGHGVRAIVRAHDEPLDELAARAASGVDAIVNAAGVAHLARRAAVDLERLRVGNVELPVALAGAALAARVPLVHVSSAKAADAGDDSPYASSKRAADERLAHEFGARFAEAGLALIIVRPPALLFPPLDAGRVGRLRFLRHLPAWSVPPVRVPVLAPATFVAAVASALADANRAQGSGGCTIREFSRSERGTLRDVRRAMLAPTEEEDGR